MTSSPPRLPAASLPVITSESGLTRYLQEIQKFPMLEPEEEFMLANRWREHGDLEAAHKLVTSHLRLVAKVALGYRGYGLPVQDLIAEGNIGMMQAVKKFDPDKGFRLATYAIWWIRASIQEYILRSWSLVKIGTTAAQKRLFFNLRRIKKEIQALDEGDMTPEQVRKIAQELMVTEQEVVDMNRRLSGPDHSLNALIRTDGDSEWQDFLMDETESQEKTLADKQELLFRHALLKEAMKTLNDREQAVLRARRLREPPATLEALAQEFDISRERVRQIENRAYAKLQLAVQKLVRENG